MSHECRHCGRSSEGLKRCTACSRVWYCNSSCQKSDWPIHLLSCNIGRPLTSADHLGAAVRQGIAPSDTQTLQDYGFLHTPRPDDVEKRMKIYSLLIDGLGIKTKTIHQWREDGVLGSMIKTTLDTNLSTNELQEVECEWFTKHQSTFGGSPPPDDASQTWFLDAYHKTRQLIARNTTKADFDRLRSVGSFYEYFLFYTLILQGACPKPCDRTGLWVTFGFCACLNQAEEVQLGDSYLSLLRAITFREFIYACDTSGLLRLFSTHGQTVPNPYIRDLLSDMQTRNSVWDLKEFACGDEGMRQYIEPALPICVDYGFFNCMSSEEEISLREVYKDILSRPDSDPLALHQACLQGKIFDHCSKLTNLSPEDKFRRLMMNLYPLPEGGSHSSDDRNEPMDESDPVAQLINSLPPGISSVSQSEIRSALKRSWQARFCRNSDPVD
ncbi:MYND Zn-finger protein [Ceratobasidium sp. AG-Ba]|nr:MYND Zn-finger protein [Ceratobasidium sp. AG-Ba]